MTTLYDIYKTQGKALPGTVAGRFADPTFAAAAKEAGVDQTSYAINSGNADINTKIAALYGKTPASNGNPVIPTVTGGSPVVTPTVDTTGADNEAAIRDANAAKAAALLNTGPTPEELEAQRKLFQQEIDSLNTVYAGERSKLLTTGQNRVGQVNVNSARMGLLGSNVGDAAQNNIENANIAEQNAADAKHNLDIAAVTQKIRKGAQDEAAARREATTKNADATIQELTVDRPARRNAEIARRVSSLLALDPNKITDQNIADAAKKDIFGITPDELKQAYTEAKTAKETQFRKDNPGFELSAGQSRYETNPLTGKREVVASIAPKAAAGGGTINSDGTTSYSTIDISRYGRAANSIAKNFIDLPQYKLTANGLPYLQRIQAANSEPGSVSDAELLDSIVKLNTGGNQVTEAQVALITGGRSYSDSLNVWKNKLSNGGVLSDTQRKQLTELAGKVFDRYKTDYQPVYDQVTKQLKDAKIPEAFWTIPDLNTLSSKETGDNTGVLLSPDGSQQVNAADLTPEQIQEAKSAGWK